MVSATDDKLDLKLDFRNFFEGLTYFDLETIMHADEITAERIENKELRTKDLWTADAGIYVIEDGKQVVYLVRGQNNPLFRATKEDYKFLTYSSDFQHYEAEKKHIEHLIKADSTLRATYSELELITEYGSGTNFDIDTADYDNTLNSKQREFAERVYGQGNKFKKSMSMLNKEGITQAKISFTSSRRFLPEENEGVRVSACVLGNFTGKHDHYSEFIIDDDYINGEWWDIHLYGKPNEYAQAFMNLQNNLSDVNSSLKGFKENLDFLLENPEKSLRHMNDTIADIVIRLKNNDKELEHMPDTIIKKLKKLEEVHLQDYLKNDGKPYIPVSKF